MGDRLRPITQIKIKGRAYNQLRGYLQPPEVGKVQLITLTFTAAKGNIPYFSANSSRCLWKPRGITSSLHPLSCIFFKLLEVLLGPCQRLLPFSIQNIPLLLTLSPDLLLHVMDVLSYLLLEVEIPLPASLDLLLNNLTGILFLLDGVKKLLDLLDVLRDIVIIRRGWLLLCEGGGEVDPVGHALVDAEGAAIHADFLLGCGLALHLF